MRQSTVGALVYLILVVSWISGFVVAKGIMQTLLCVFPPYAWYLVLDSINRTYQILQ